MNKVFQGQCLCEAVRFEARGTVNRISACYCSQCRTQNGGGPFYGVELQGDLAIEDNTALVWFASSDRAKRAFCGICGSSLFWQANKDRSLFDVSLGALNDASGLTLDAHIFVDRCPAYLKVPDTAPHMTDPGALTDHLDGD